MFGSTDIESVVSKLRISLPASLRDWTDQQVAAGNYRDAGAYVIALIDADMGPARHQGQTRSEWIKAQIKSRNHKDADAYARHLIERDMTSKNLRSSPNLASIEADVLSHLLYIRKVVDDLQSRLSRLEERHGSK